MNILLVVTGSIAAYKAPDLANAFRQHGHDVRVVLTAAAQQFITPLAFRGQRLETFVDADEWQYRQGVLHIDLAQWADILLVAPATANTLAKLASGVTDNLALSVLRAFTGAIYVAPAMNTQMYLNSSDVRENLVRLRNCVVIPPRHALLACGETGTGALARKETIVAQTLKPLFPLNMRVVGTTADSFSFQAIEGGLEVEIPTPDHCGGFGFVRKHHIHEGTDLYAPDGKPVYACEAGLVTHVGPFTGVEAGSPWWESTHSITVQECFGNRQTTLYGEVSPAPGVQAGTRLKKGQLLGYVKQVLRENKGRPMAMLHLERYEAGTLGTCNEWPLNHPRPRGLEDAGAYLQTCLPRQSREHP